jgi:hypothetical protein
MLFDLPCRGGGWQLAEDFHRGLKASVGKHFAEGSSSAEHPVIHCMSHSQGTLWAIAILYPNINDDDYHGASGMDCKYGNLRQPVIRGSDDFWPQVCDDYFLFLTGN